MASPSKSHNRGVAKLKRRQRRRNVRTKMAKRPKLLRKNKSK